MIVIIIIIIIIIIITIIILTWRRRRNEITKFVKIMWKFALFSTVAFSYEMCHVWSMVLPFELVNGPGSSIGTDNYLKWYTSNQKASDA